jgi:predicted transcriptional regulator
MKELSKAGIIQRKRQGGRATQYTYVYEKEGKGETVGAHVRTEDYFFTQKFKIKGELRFLKNSEIDVLSLIYTHTRDPKSQQFEGSYKDIAGILNMRTETVCRAVSALLAADLICRPTKGVNGHSKSIFKAQMKNFRKIERKVKKEEKARSYVAKDAKDAKDADARSERQRYYDLLKDAAQARVDYVEKEANANARFRELTQNLRAIELSLAKAELGKPEELPKLKASKASMLRERESILNGIGYTSADLLPRWKCSKCSDSGYLPNGRACDCYSPPGRL